MKLTPFHLAIQVSDLTASRHFYSGVLGCKEGRSDQYWIDFDLFGHQLVCHLNPDLGNETVANLHRNMVDGHGVPVPHFGVVLETDQWQMLASKLKRHNMQFIIEPYVRFKGEVGEQSTMFFNDPSGNALEFKAFKNITQLFAK